MSRRRFIWQKAQAQSGLPEGYTAVEYIQTSGSQRIDTGVKSSASVGLSADFCLVDASTIQNLASVYDPYKNYQLMVLAASSWGSPDGAVWFVCGYSAIQYFKKADTDRHVYHFNADGQYAVEMDGIQYAKADPSQTTFPADARNLWLFVRNSPAVDGYARMKLYSCAMYDGGVKIRDFKPCLDADGVPCLYDLISKTAFYNQGWGSFTWG
ncbi:MAG: hypothetical protein PUE45_01205 [Oscillospiraceae bacterium]|nr:hypothetical protein [Oscillospiraceae bacterium]